mgnify:CR=1 FL=1
MHHDKHRYDIDKLMQTFPVMLESLLHLFGRGNGQWNDQHEGDESDSDKRSLGDIQQYLIEVEELVQPNVSKKVHTGVEKRKQP